ncbi:MAG: GerMN domain-containing protein [Spirulinaceae cyanobacterium]
MEEQEKSRQFSFSTIAGISAASLIAVGSITGLLAWHILTSSTDLSSSKSEYSPNSSQTSKLSSSKIQQKEAQVFWIDASGSDIELVPSPIAIEKEKSNQPEAVLDSAFKRLLAGSPTEELATSIPEGTKLNSIKIKEDGIHIDLSKEFTTGGGSASMMGRVAQILHTATSLEPKAPVWLEVEGERLETLGGEGLLIEQPLTRADFREDFEL